ncbi:MAG: hypothetical protein AAGH70_09790 [Pseudomonadota bacterium]
MASFTAPRERSRPVSCRDPRADFYVPLLAALKDAVLEVVIGRATSVFSLLAVMALIYRVTAPRG